MFGSEVKGGLLVSRHIYNKPAQTALMLGATLTSGALPSLPETPRSPDGIRARLAK